MVGLKFHNLDCVFDFHAEVEHRGLLQVLFVRIVYWHFYIAQQVFDAQLLI